MCNMQLIKIKNHNDEDDGDDDNKIHKYPKMKTQKANYDTNRHSIHLENQ